MGEEMGERRWRWGGSLSPGHSPMREKAGERGREGTETCVFDEGCLEQEAHVLLSSCRKLHARQTTCLESRPSINGHLTVADGPMDKSGDS